MYELDYVRLRLSDCEMILTKGRPLLHDASL